MDSHALKQHRMARLEAAVLQLSQGNKSEFGRRLGYKDGAFVRQMLAGTRPITEKTIAQIEDIRGMAGWFRTHQSASRPHTPPNEASSQPSVKALEAALLLIANELRKARALTKASVVPLFELMAHENSESVLIAHEAAFLLAKSSPPQQSPDDRSSQKGLDFLQRDNEVEENGPSDRTGEEPESRPGSGGNTGGGASKRKTG